MTLWSEKYSVPARTVSGSVSVEPEDVVLNVNTSSSSATITLQQFSSTKWNTVYKLFIVDTSGNAGTNNITITAPAGYTINGSSTAVINQNYGSAIVRIVNATTYQAQLSSFSNTNTPLPYFTARKLLTGATTYFTQDGAGVISVLSGQSVSSYDSSTVSNLSGFNTSTGIWTVATAGYYMVSAKMITRILNGDVNSLVDGGGLGWMSAGTGYMAIACTSNAGGGAPSAVVCSEKQAVVVDLVSDINIGCEAQLFYLPAGTSVKVQVLNKTNHNVEGMASTPTCYIDFTAIKVG